MGVVCRTLLADIDGAIHELSGGLWIMIPSCKNYMSTWYNYPHDTTNGCLWSEPNSLAGYTTSSWKLSPCKRWSLGMGRIAHLSLLFIRKCWWWKHMPHSVLFWNIWLHHKHWIEAHFASISLQASLWPQLSYILFSCYMLGTESLQMK